MKSFLISIHPKWVIKILNGEKTIEVRKTAPKEWADYLSGKTMKKPEPMTGYIYCTKTIKPFSDYDWGEFTFDDLPKLGKVVACFTLREVEKLERYTGVYVPETMLHTKSMQTRHRMEKETCLTMDEIWEYTKGNGYAWHISDLVIFDKPMKLSDFYTKQFVYDKQTKLGAELHNRLDRAPQSWCYVEA